MKENIHPTVLAGARSAEMPMLLSIDFDYWIPCSHHLQPFTTEKGGQEDIEQWQRRVFDATTHGVDLRRAIRFSRQEQSPSSIAPSLNFNPNGVGVMDQHVFAYDHFGDVKNAWLVHVDAHHDMGYARTDGLHCGNWVQRLIEKGSVKRVTLIYPTWRQTRSFFAPSETENVIRKKRLDAEIEVFHGLHHLRRNIPFERTVICRSGSWTPPWLDEAFNQFAKSFGGKSRIYEPTPARSFDYELLVQCVQFSKRRKHLLCSAVEGVF